MRYLGYFYDDLSLKILCNAADLTVVLSLYENLSNDIMESLACGTPVVAFKIGGNEDLISHKQNGYLAEPYDSVDLARGIDWVLAHPEPQKLSSKAILKVENCFEMQKVTNQYRSLYEDILRKG